MADRRPRYRHAGLVALGSLLLASAGAHAAHAQEGPPTDLPAQDAGQDLSALSIEQLMDVEIVSASKFRQKGLDAPSSVTVVTADDIKTFGYRTMADIVRSVRGMYISYDRFYDYIGVRGFKPPGDYNDRVLLLIDGYRTNDPIYDSASIGDDFPLNIDLIDRVEIVRGPGSSVYGGNAFFAVINVITKSGPDIDGLRVTAAVAGFGTDKESVTFGKQFDNGAAVLFSATRAHRDGDDLFFPEYDTPETNNGIATRLDWTDVEQVFGKVQYKGFTLSASHSKRERGLPAAPYGVTFNDPRTNWVDTYTLVDLSHYGELTPRWSLSSHLFYGHYTSNGDSAYVDDDLLLRDEATGNWWGLELQALGRFGRHKLVLGGEFQDNFRQDQKSFTVGGPDVFLDDRRSSRRLGVYAQDEITLSSNLLLNAGVRYDRYSGRDDTVNPRIGLIWKPRASTTIKALYGSAFRDANVYEIYYNDGNLSYKSNPGLKPEKIKSYELALEHAFDARTRLTATAYYNDVTDVVVQFIDPVDGLLVFQNFPGGKSKGIEFALDRIWRNEVRLRGSYAYQVSRAKQFDVEVPDSPRHLAKLHLSAPLFDRAARLGAEMQYMSGRLTQFRDTVDSHLITNLTVSTDRLPGGVELSASIYNVFDVRYSDPAGPDLIQDAIPQDGRTFRIKLSRTF